MEKTMLNLNLEALGVTEEALEKTILSTLGLSREGAVKALAEKFDVAIPSGEVVVAAPVSAGDEVLTSQGASKAAILTEDELSTLRKAASITNRLFA